LLKAGFIQPCKYAEWVANIVPVEKKATSKIWICVNFQNLNRVTPKDEYPMPVEDIMINNASSNKMISFLDGNAGYNQIFMARENVHKTTFWCPGFVELFEWIVITFGLKNVGATYQWTMNLIFHDLLGDIMEVYIDDIVIKLASFDEHLADLRMALERMKKYGLRMNPFTCSFGVSAGRFLGFIVHEHGIQIDPKKIESIHKLEEPTCKIDVQK
jgi:ribonuclease HI